MGTVCEPPCLGLCCRLLSSHAQRLRSISPFNISWTTEQLTADALSPLQLPALSGGQQGGPEQQRREAHWPHRPRLQGAGQAVWDRLCLTVAVLQTSPKPPLEEYKDTFPEEWASDIETELSIHQGGRGESERFHTVDSFKICKAFLFAFLVAFFSSVVGAFHVFIFLRMEDYTYSLWSVANTYKDVSGTQLCPPLILCRRLALGRNVSFCLCYVSLLLGRGTISD